MNRRKFIAALSAAELALAARAAQQPNRMRRIGVLLPYDESDPEPKTYPSAFVRGLAELGWTEEQPLALQKRFRGFGSRPDMGPWPR
jgi:putative tryptophan/tyrosine transport system substrate-binding protein